MNNVSMTTVDVKVKTFFYPIRLKKLKNKFYVRPKPRSRLLGGFRIERIEDLRMQHGLDCVEELTKLLTDAIVANRND